MVCSIFWSKHNPISRTPIDIDWFVVFSFWELSCCTYFDALDVISGMQKPTLKAFQQRYQHMSEGKHPWNAPFLGSCIVHSLKNHRYMLIGIYILISCVHVHKERDYFAMSFMAKRTKRYRNSVFFSKRSYRTMWAPTSCRWGSNSYKEGYNPSCLFIQPFMGVITPFISSRGPPCRSDWFGFSTSVPPNQIPSLGGMCSCCFFPQSHHRSGSRIILKVHKQ